MSQSKLLKDNETERNRVRKLNTALGDQASQEARIAALESALEVLDGRVTALEPSGD